jgi:hypothetical protein
LSSSFLRECRGGDTESLKDQVQVIELLRQVRENVEQGNDKLPVVFVFPSKGSWRASQLKLSPAPVFSFFGSPSPSLRDVFERETLPELVNLILDQAEIPRSSLAWDKDAIEASTAEAPIGSVDWVLDAVLASTTGTELCQSNESKRVKIQNFLFLVNKDVEVSLDNFLFILSYSDDAILPQTVTDLGSYFPNRSELSSSR